MNMIKANENFGAFIQDLRKERGNSLEEIAVRSGVIASYIWRIEKQKRQPSLDVQLKILAHGFYINEELLGEFAQAYIKEMNRKKSLIAQ